MMMDKGHFRAEIDAEDLEDVQVSISMCCPLETSEAMLGEDAKTLFDEYQALRAMVSDYVNFLYELRREALAYAV